MALHEAQLLQLRPFVHDIFRFYHHLLVELLSPRLDYLSYLNPVPARTHI